MKPWKKIALLSAAAVALACASFFAGRLTAKPLSWQDVVVAHAEILERDGNYFHINGLSCNDINGQGEYTFTISKDTLLEWRYTPITVEDLKPGDRIAVAYTGPVLLSYPAQLTQVLRIQLLEDDK